MRRILSVLFLGCMMHLAHAQTATPISGYCIQGGTQAKVQGLPATNYHQGVVPGCTVTVYLTGTQTLATLYSNSTGTPLSNPFTASGGTPAGYWQFYPSSATQAYDVVLSGGTCPNCFSAPVTIPGISVTAAGNYCALVGCTMSGGITGPIFQTGTITGNSFTMSAQSSIPSSWTFDVTSPASALSSLGGMPSSGGTFTGALFASPFNDVVYASQYASLNAASAACPLSGGCTIVVNSATSLSGSLTLPSTTTLMFAQPGQIGAGTLTINAPPVAPRSQIFNGTTVSFGYQVTKDYPEWFGAVGDGNQSTGAGTDDTAAIQSAIGALSSGTVDLAGEQYKISSTLTITHSTINLCGVNRGYTGSPAGVSVIFSTSASADILDVYGASSSVKILWNKICNVALERSVVPTGTAAGLSVNHVGGVVVDGVQSQDSIRDFYFHDAPAYGTGIIENSQAAWGFLASGYSSGVSLYGFYIDSADGLAMNTQTLFNVAATTNNLTADTSYGVYVYGSAINDFETEWVNTESTSYGIWVQCTATTGDGCQDTHYVNSIIDGYFLKGIYVTGVVNSALGSVTIQNGWVASAASTATYGVDVENSQGVSVDGLVVHSYNTDIGIQIGSSSAVHVTNNNMIGQNQSIIALYSSTDCTVSGNTLQAVSGSPTPVFINVVTGSTNNTIMANNISGYGTWGVVVDATSNNNRLLGNAIDTAHLTSGAVSDSGSGNGHNVKTLTGSATLTFTSIAAFPGQQTQTVTIPGAAVANYGVSCNPQSTPASGQPLSWTVSVASANTVGVTMTNLGNATNTPNAVQWNCSVVQP